ncbi:MAG: hypothetical protein J6S87_02670, partial [Bacteroidales bacterium]|nr:hypothetical protein [Bacteroidales bacterium]
MRYRKLIYLLLLFVPLALYSCVKEPIDGDKSDEEQTTIPYTVTVTDGTGTKATVEGNYGSFHYVFEEGDALFVTDCDALHVPGSTNDPDDATIYGVLTLVSGAGETTGTFSGDLICVGGAKPENDTQLYATLVSQKDVIHEHAKGKITGIISDTETQKGWCSVDAVDATAYEDAVSRYSNFQGSALYSDERFTLSQSSVFLVFNLYFSSSDSGSKTISVYDGSTVVRSKELTLPATGTKQLSFIAAFPDASAFSGDASVYVDGVAYPFDATLLTANYFYNVARTVGFDGLTIKATQTGTTTITYNLSKTIQYNLNGSGWQNLNNTINSGNISLNQNDVVFFRGNSSNNNYPQPSGSPVMAFDQDCDVFGDMMSLLCSVSGDEYTIQHSLNNKTNVFKGFFAGNTHINIPADKDLLLPATTLTTSCYEAMFSGCTGLTKAPVLGSPTTLAASCYKQMFKDSGLTTAPSGIMDPNVTTIPASACYLMFKDCKALTTGPSSIAATSLGTNACQEMFSGCDHLTTALASTTLGGATFDTNACFQMFKGCSALTTGPSSIVATSFGAHACEEMFSGCTSLTTALSSLAASSSVGDYGFRKMFYG